MPANYFIPSRSLVTSARASHNDQTAIE